MEVQVETPETAVRVVVTVVIEILAIAVVVVVIVIACVSSSYRCTALVTVSSLHRHFKKGVSKNMGACLDSDAVREIIICP